MTESPHVDSISVRDENKNHDVTNENIDSMKQTHETISYNTFNSFSSSGNPSIDYDTDTQPNANPNKKTNNNSSRSSNSSGRSIYASDDEITEQPEPDTETEATEPMIQKYDDNDDNDDNNDKRKPTTEITERMDTFDVDQLYMDDGAATDSGGAAAAASSTSTEDFHDEPDAAADTIRVEMLKSRQFFPDDDEDDDDDEDGNGDGDKGKIDHSGGGAIDKYGDYENDNAQNRDQRPYKHSKSGGYSSIDGKTHENDDFDRHPYSQSSSVKSDTKDSIKIISTPLGKVSIIYQSNTNNGSGGANGAIATTSNVDSKLKLFENSNQNSMNKFKNFYSHNINAGAKQNLTNPHRSTLKNREHHRHNHHYPQQQHHQQQSSVPNGAGVDATGTSTAAAAASAAAAKGGRGTNQMNDKTKLLQKQITPVLTADGKVALLYRGAQDGTNGQPKIEIGKNLTDFSHSINNSPDGIGNNGKLNYNIVSEGVLPDKLPEIIAGESIVATNQTERIATKNMEKLAVIVAAETTTTTTRTKLTTFAPIANTERPILRLFKSDESTSRNTNEEENSILPNINRPPSEVLGIKKNQFTQFRITDLIATATPTLTNQDITERTPGSSYGNERPKSIDSFGNEHGPDDGFVPPAPPQSPNFDYDYNGNNNHENHYPNHLATPSIDFGGGGGAPPSSSHGGSIDDSTTISDVLSKAEVVNLAIIPAFEGDLHRFHEQQQNDVSNDNNPYYNMMDHEDGGGDGGNVNDIGIAGKQHKHRHHNVKDLSALHCAMQALVAIAALATVFGMLGAYFKQRILDQLTINNGLMGIRFWIALNRRSGMFV